MSAKVIQLRARDPAAPGLSDAALLSGCAAEDSGALGALFSRHQKDVYRFLCRLVGPRCPELDDLVQQVFLAAWQQADRYRAEASVRAWLFGIAANLARKHHRTERRRSNAFLLFAQRLTSWVTPPPEEAVANRQLIDRLAEGLEALPHDLKVAYVMCEIEELPGVEAAKVLGVRPGTMWRRLHDARQRLRRMIEVEP